MLSGFAVRCFVESRLVGPELTGGVGDDPPSLDGGLVMHLTLQLAASMKIMASSAYREQLDDLPLFREEPDQSIWIDDWISSTTDAI